MERIGKLFRINLNVKHQCRYRIDITKSIKITRKF